MLQKDLRARAEDVFRLTRRDVAELANHDVQRLVHELQVHQIELEMQNESLCRAQIDIEKSQEQYRQLFDDAPVAYCMLDADAVVVRANAAAVTLLGVSPSRIVGQPLTAFIARQDRALLQTQIRGAHREGRATCEVMVSESAGRAVHAQLDIRVPRPATDCLVALTDVSERKRSHVALERVNQELEARVAARTVDLETRNRQLEAEIRARVASEAQQRALESRMRESDRFQSLGLLAAGIAHDFNNLLVGVLGNAELLLLTPGLADRWRVPLSLIKRAGQQASDLTRQLLVFAGMGQLTTASVNLPRIVTESLEFLRTRLPQGIQLQAQITADLPAIEADRSQISQIVINLVTNAIEAVDERGVIVVQTRAEQLSADTLAEFQYNADIEPGEFAMLRVQDCGPGIDASTVKRIFDPFFSTKFAGRGLGLATVLGIVQAHRGALRVRSKPGEGTSFDIAFPLAAARVSSERPDVHQDQTNLVVGSGPVLLIDDDDSVRAVVGQLLALLGFEVTAANSGQAGLDLFCRGEPSFKFVVLDWMMPGLSGEQVLGSLRELKPALPVILISGYNAGELAANDGNVVRVQKPMTLARLRDAVCSVIDAQRVSA